MTRRQSSKVLAVQPCFPEDKAIAKRELGARTYKRVIVNGYKLP